MTVSVTVLSGYLYCKRKLFLEQVLGLAEVPKEAVVKGKIKHRVFDLVNKAEEGIVKSINKNTSFESCLETYKRHYSKFLRAVLLRNRSLITQAGLSISRLFEEFWSYFAKEAELRARNVFEFAEKHKVYGEKLWDELTPKIISELRLASDTFKLKGVVDQVELFEDLAVPVELKTGRKPSEGVWPSHRVQLGAYMLLLKENFGKEVRFGFVRYLDSGELRKVFLTPFLEQEITDILAKVQALLASTRLPERCTNIQKCKACGLREVCYDDARLNKLLEELKNERERTDKKRETKRATRRKELIKNSKPLNNS